jgi:hypothetical protein
MLFDLARDPLERFALDPSGHAHAARLEASIRDRSAALPQAAGAAAAAPTAEELEKLRSLGYVN